LAGPWGGTRFLAAAATPRSGWLAWLVVTESPDRAARGRLIEVEDELRLSRADPASGAETVALADEFVSIRHATVRRQQAERVARFTVEDRAEPSPSANGTFCNDRRLAPGERALLADGDRIRIGLTELRFKSLWLGEMQP
jgi:hypothetical protein